MSSNLILEKETISFKLLCPICAVKGNYAVKINMSNDVPHFNKKLKGNCSSRHLKPLKITK